MDNFTICTIALTCIPKISKRQALEIYKYLGNTAEPVFNLQTEELKQKLNLLSTPVFQLLAEGRKVAFERAQKESLFVEKHGIDCLCYGTDHYPQRLLECDDAPLLLYYKGNADLNCTYALAMVGTRKCTEYGKDMCRKITADLKRMRPDTLIVSGLAYGIDIHSHRGALQAGLQTVAVLAHGLDRIYPYTHRDTAKEMLRQGGLLTEYMIGTTPERGNFLSRNRIVAGMTDGCLVVESAERGGSLVTARIAMDYHRDVLAVPGRVGDACSEGCNNLIYKNRAALITGADNILDTLNWPNMQIEASQKNQPIEQDLFQHLSEEEQLMVHLLENSEGKQVNQLVIESNMPVHRISAILFELEMKGIVRLIAGGRYHLIG